MTQELVMSLVNGGPYGALVAFMVWDRIQQNRISKDRIAADISMATAITLLTAKIEGHAR